MHLLTSQHHRIAVLSAHTSPLARLGGHKAGGMNVYVRETALELARLGHQIDVFTRDDGGGPEIVPIGPRARVIHLGAGPRDAVDKGDLWPHLPAFLHNLRAFKQRHGLRYDLVHSHYWMSGWAGGYLQRLWDVPHVTMFHTLGAVKNRARPGEHEPAHRIAAERRVIATADAIVAATDHEVGLLQELYDADPARLAVIPCGVNLERFRPGDQAVSRAILGIDTDAPVILFVGRLEPLKGADLLIDALALLEDSRTTLLIVGGDEHNAGYVRGLRRRAKVAGVAERVRFAGAAPQEQLPLYYRAADVCAVPSFYESFGLVAVEAMACGTPVVASRVGGLTETVHDGENGFLIPSRSPEAFALKLGGILADPALRGQMQQAALVTAGHYRWSSVATQLDTLYRSLWQSRAQSGCHARPTAAAVAERDHELCHIG